jgi:hypothetical protein
MNRIRFTQVFFSFLFFVGYCYSQDRIEKFAKAGQPADLKLQDVFKPELNPKDDLCIPQYSTGCGMGDGFNDFAVAEIENYNSNCEDNSGEGWSQYLDLGPAILFPGVTYDFIFKTGYDDQFVTIWIDFNDDFELSVDEIILFDFELNQAGQFYTAEVTMPMTPYLGMHYMRARTNWQSSCDDPCESYGYGEAEDYYVIIGDAASGSVEGQVSKLTGGAPVSGATITLSGAFDYSFASEPDGSYLFDYVFVGDYTISCEKEGYNIFDYEIVVEENLTIEIDFQLTQPTIDLGLSNIDIEIPVNGEYEEMGMIENNGDGPLNWSASIAFLSDEIKEFLDLQFEYPVANGYGEAGIETDGEFIYTTMWNGNQINKYNLDGSFIETFTIDGVFGLRDLAFDGTHFYGAGSAPVLFEMDFENKELISSLDLPFMVRAIAYNHDEDYFYANNWNTDIVWFDKEGNVLGSFEAGPLGENYYGFAYDNVSFGGPYLWGYAQSGDSENELVQIQLPSGTETGFTLDVATVIPGPVFGAAGGLFTHPNLIYGKWTIGGLIQGEKIWGLELSEAQTWIGLAPYAGTLGPGESQSMNVLLNAIDLQPGEYNAEIHFISYPEVGTPIIDVKMNVITGGVSVSGKNNLSDGFTVFPNPVSGNLFIEVNEVPCKLSLTNSQGRLLKTKTIFTKSSQLDLSSFEAGIYFIMVEAGSKRVLKKVIME